MNHNNRIIRIEAARTNAELLHATDGYHEHILAAHPALRVTHGFNVAMRARRYLCALNDVKRAARGRGDRYGDVIRVLECASQKQFALEEF
jgi:hypothetical protein